MMQDYVELQSITENKNVECAKNFSPPPLGPCSYFPYITFEAPPPPPRVLIYGKIYKQISYFI